MNTGVRTRPIADSASKPKMPRHVRLQFNPLRDRMVVLAPERIFWPDGVGVDVLQLCDGGRSVSEIAAKLAEGYNAPAEIIERDVLEFVQEWLDKRLLIL
jgi:pyrroloquinoline quinone biosynthesis protein D